MFARFHSASVLGVVALRSLHMFRTAVRRPEFPVSEGSDRMSTSLLKPRKRPVRTEGPLVLVGALATVVAMALATYPVDRPTMENIRRPAMAASAEPPNELFKAD